MKLQGSVHPRNNPDRRRQAYPSSDPLVRPDTSSLRCVAWWRAQDLIQWWQDGQTLDLSLYPWPSVINSSQYVFNNSDDATFIVNGLHGKPCVRLSPGGHLELSNTKELSYDKDWTLVLVGGYPNFNNTTDTFKVLGDDPVSPSEYVALDLWSNKPSEDLTNNKVLGLVYKTTLVADSTTKNIYTEIGNTTSRVGRSVLITGSNVPFVYLLRNKNATLCFRQHDGSSPQEFNPSLQNVSWSQSLSWRYVTNINSSSYNLCISEILLFDKALDVGLIDSEYGKLFSQYFQPKYNLCPFVQVWVRFSRWPPGTSMRRFNGVWARNYHRKNPNIRNDALRPVKVYSDYVVPRVVLRYDYMDYYSGNNYIDGLSKGYNFNIWNFEPWSTRSLD